MAEKGDSDNRKEGGGAASTTPSHIPVIRICCQFLQKSKP